MAKGAFRAYVIDERGTEHTVQLAIEDWWITDYNGYINQTAATMFVVALEDSIVFQIDYENEKRLSASDLAFQTFFRIMAERTAAYHQRRIISNLMENAEQRFDNFIKQYPVMASRVPQYALASFLGMTTGFLSKIRSRRARKS